MSDPTSPPTTVCRPPTSRLIAARLDRWDAATEPWTRRYLAMIEANEAVRAPDLADRVGMDVPRFKRRVRQLKGLGLTISLDVGYRLSPRGRAFLAANPDDGAMLTTCASWPARE